MAYHIRPLSFSEILDRSLRVLVDNFWLLTGIMASLWIPYDALGAAGRYVNALNFVALSLLPIGSTLATATLVCAVSKIYVGEPTGMLAAVREVRPIFWRVLGTTFLMFALLFLGGLALAVPSFYFGVCWCFAGPVMIVERRFGMTALSRSRGLVRGVWLQAFAITSLPGLLIAIPITLATYYLWGNLPLVAPILTTAVQSVASAYVRIVIVVYYFDRRCRTEDFDLRLLAEQIRSEDNASRAAAPGAAA